MDESSCICNAGSAATARRRAMSAASAQPCALHHEPQPVRQAPMPMQRVIMTRSRSSSAASDLPASACQGNEASAAQESQKLRPCPAIPDIPDGPLVISAGWGRTGTSSLKVSSLQCQPVAAHSMARRNGVKCLCMKRWLHRSTGLAQLDLTAVMPVRDLEGHATIFQSTRNPSYRPCIRPTWPAKHPTSRVWEVCDKFHILCRWHWTV